MMREVGFRNVEARIVYHSHAFSSAENFIDSWFYLSQDDPEFSEMGAQNRHTMTRELQSALHPFKCEKGFDRHPR